MGKVTERARALLAAWDEYGAELQFVENAAGTKVHVVASPNLPDWARPAESWRRVEVEDIINLTRGVTPAVCGFRARRNRGGVDVGGRLTNTFPDELLCVNCHRAFGDRAALIFECNLLNEIGIL